MSRSEKKVPIIKYGGLEKWGKRFANRRVRKTDVGDNGNYKKLYEQWDIWDYKTNLYRKRKIDGIPVHYGNEVMTYEEIMEHWRK